jgi:hypothetical protein
MSFDPFDRDRRVITEGRIHVAVSHRHLQRLREDRVYTQLLLDRAAVMVFDSALMLTDSLGRQVENDEASKDDGT